MSYQDYPTEPIGGGNPYHRCVCCKRSVPEINGQPDRHAAWCDYRTQPAPAITSESGKPASQGASAITSVEAPRLTDEEIDDLQRENNAAYHRGDVTPRRFARAIEAALIAKWSKT